MSTKTIKALVNGVIQNIEVEDIVSPEQPLSYEERLDALESEVGDVSTILDNINGEVV